MMMQAGFRLHYMRLANIIKVRKEKPGHNEFELQGGPGWNEFGLPGKLKPELKAFFSRKDWSLPPCGGGYTEAIRFLYAL